MTPDEIRDLPGSWYASQPVPLRLLIAIDAPTRWIQTARLLPRDDRSALAVNHYHDRNLSLVERAHVRAANRLLRNVLSD